MNSAGKSTAKKRAWRSGPVFPDLVDRRAFLDKVILSVWGTTKEETDTSYAETVSRRAIAGLDRNYGWAESGVLPMTGNPFQLKFGVLRLRGVIPPLQLTVRSEASPIKMAELETAVRDSCAEAWKIQLSQLELTFDLSGFTVGDFRRNILTRSEKSKDFKDRYGRQTHYTGSRRSPWQVKVYDKTKGICRFEWTLRRPFLRASGVDTIADLERLRNLDLSRVRIGEVNESAMECLEAQLMNAIRGDDLLEDVMTRVFRSRCFVLPLRDFLSWTRFAQWPVPENFFLERSRLDRRIARMQQNLML